MIRAPTRPSIYHIVHADKVESILDDGLIWCDAEIARRRIRGTTIGMGSIKERRLRLPVKCHRDCYVGDFVPFYFCPRSVMLYVIHCANHPELRYRGGQGPIVHLELDMLAVIDWAKSNERRWAFTASNAGAVYTSFYKSIDRLAELDWDAIRATDFRDAEVKENKQAEFLVEHSVPWSLVGRVGVKSAGVRDRVSQLLRQRGIDTTIAVMPAWYY